MGAERTLKQVGLALRAARLQKDLRQAELSRILGVERIQIAQHETGKMPVPPALADAYARALGVTPEAFKTVTKMPTDSDREAQ